MSYPDEFNHPRPSTCCRKCSVQETDDSVCVPCEHCSCHNDRGAYFLSVLRTTKRKLEDALRTVDEAIKNVSEK